MLEIKKIAETLVSLSRKDINNLSKLLKEEYGIEPSLSYKNTVSYKMEEKIEKKVVKIFIKSYGNSKLIIIKLIKEITGLGLKESKELVDNFPKLLKENMKQEEANLIKKQLEEAGASVELKTND